MKHFFSQKTWDLLIEESQACAECEQKAVEAALSGSFMLPHASNKHARMSGIHIPFKRTTPAQKLLGERMDEDMRYFWHQNEIKRGLCTTCNRYLCGTKPEPTFEFKFSDL